MQCAFQAEVLQISMRCYPVLLQEQPLKMLHGIAYGGRKIRDQQRFGKMLIDQAYRLLQSLIAYILQIQPSGGA
ncbi:hypothetical protein D3C81_2078010 [compost metagenome]